MLGCLGREGEITRGAAGPDQDAEDVRSLHVGHLLQRQ